MLAAAARAALLAAAARARGAGRRGARQRAEDIVRWRVLRVRGGGLGF